MRHPSVPLVVLLAAVALPGLRGAAQIAPPPPPPPPPGLVQAPPPTGTGLIAGQVIDSESGKPIGDTAVNLSSRTNLVAPTMARGAVPSSLTVITDSQGRFFFANLAAGTFTVTGNKTGYSRIPGVAGAGATIELVDGERVTNARVRLLKSATMSGTLRDEAGDPVVGTGVLLGRRAIVNGRAEPQVVNVATSDDRGMFRFTNVTPGDYYVCACQRDPIPFDQTLLTTLAAQPLQLLSLAGRALTMGADAVTLDNSLRTYAPAFHPNSPSPARASVVTLASGEDRQNVDILVPLVRAARVTGRVIGAQSPVNAGFILLVPVDDTGFSVRSGFSGFSPMLVQPDGRFDFANIPPGQYRLVVNHRETAGRGGGPSGAAMQFVGSRGTPIPIGPLVAGRGQPMLDEPPLWADEVITIPDRSTVNVDVTLQRGVRVNGRVELIGAAPTPPGPAGAPLLRFTVNLASLGSVPWVQQSTIAPDGRSFSVFGSGPGKYTMSTPSMAGLTVRSVTIGGQDVTDLPVDLGTRDLNDVVVTFTSEQRGSIAIATSAPPAGQAPLDDVALVFPADRRYWAFPTSALPRYANLPLTSKGTATVSNLPGGDYYVLLVPPHESVNWQETTRMEALSRRAQIVTVLEGQKKTVEVKR